MELGAIVLKSASTFDRNVIYSTMPPKVCSHLDEKVVLRAKTWVSKSVMRILTQLQKMRELTQLGEMIEVNNERPWRISGKASLNHHLVAL